MSEDQFVTEMNLIRNARAAQEAVNALGAGPAATQPTTIQTDPSRCWVRIDHKDDAVSATGEPVTFQRTLIGDAWAMEPYGPPGLENEFSLTIRVKLLRRGPSWQPSGSGAGMRLTIEEGTALRDALNQWLDSDRT